MQTLVDAAAADLRRLAEDVQELPHGFTDAVLHRGARRRRRQRLVAGAGVTVLVGVAVWSAVTFSSDANNVQTVVVKGGSSASPTSLTVTLSPTPKGFQIIHRETDVSDGHGGLTSALVLAQHTRSKQNPVADLGETISISVFNGNGYRPVPDSRGRIDGYPAAPTTIAGNNGWIMNDGDNDYRLAWQSNNTFVEIIGGGGIPPSELEDVAIDVSVG